MEPRVLAGGVKTVENGRVDRVFEIVRPRFSGRWGTSVYMYGGDWIFAGELPTAGFYFSTEGVLFCQPDGGLAGVGVTLGRFNDAGLGSRQDKALKPVGASRHFRLMLQTQSRCKNQP